MEEKKVDILDEFQKAQEVHEDEARKQKMAEDDAWFDKQIVDLSENAKNRWEDFFCSNREQALYEASYFHEYMNALVGFSNSDVGIYSYEKCIKCLIDSYTEKDIRICNPDIADDEVLTEDRLADLKYEMATEWFDYNVLRALPYEYEKAPIILYHFMTDEEEF